MPPIGTTPGGRNWGESSDIHSRNHGRAVPHPKSHPHSPNKWYCTNTTVTSFCLPPDDRLQGRKADLVAKILARTEGSHEIIGGVGGRVAKQATPAPTAGSISTTTKGGTGRTSSDSDGDSSGDNSASPSSAEEVRGGGSEGHDTNCDSDNAGRGGRGNKPLAGRVQGSPPPPSSCIPAAEDSTHYAPREGGELRRSNTRNSIENATVTAGGDAATAAPTTTDDGQGREVHREKDTCAPPVPPPDGSTESGSGGGSGGRVGKVGGEGVNDTLAQGASKSTKKAGVSKKKKKDDDDDVYNTPRSRPQTNKNDSAAVRRSLRRRLEQAAVRTAATSLPAETEHNEEEDAGGMADGKEVWDVLVSIPLTCSRGGSGGNGRVSLEKLFGDGITAESLVGIGRGLRYAFRKDAEAGGGGREQGRERGEEGWSSTERASEVCICFFRLFITGHETPMAL